MLKYNLVSRRVVIDPVSLLLRELKDIWDADESAMKEEATEQLTFVHLVSQLDADAPFSDSSPSEVVELVARNIWHEGNPRKRPARSAITMLLAIVDSYRKAYETPERRVLRRYNAKIDEISELVDSTSPRISQTRSNAYTSNLGIITKALAELDNLLDLKDKMASRIARQQGKDFETVGDKKPSILERKHGK